MHDWSAAVMWWLQVSTIDKLLSAFIQPLQSDNISTTQKPLPSPSSSSSSDGIIDSDSDSTFTNDHSSSDSSSSSSTNAIYRVHCSLNLNTETGRLSARRPNLQNQPALEKDRYKVGRGINTQYIPDSLHLHYLPVCPF